MADQKFEVQKPTSMDLIAEYIHALTHADFVAMQALRSESFELDWVHADAFADAPLTHAQANQFWPVWFAAFSEMDYEVTRTIAAEQVVVVQWVFRGTHAAPLAPPVFDPPLEATGKTIRIRGISVFDIAADRIQRESMYIDLATLWVELGVTP